MTLVESLPYHLSACILVACDDLEKAVAAGLRVDMDYWVRLDEETGKPCTVCFAGACMVARNDFHHFKEPMYRCHNTDRYFALNLVRYGQLLSAAQEIYPKDTNFKPLKNIRAHNYWNDRNPELSTFLQDMRRLAADLEEIGF